MKYVAKLLNNVNNVNDFQVADEYLVELGNTFKIYFQLFIARDNADGTSRLTRYIPQGTNNYVEVKVYNIDDDFIINRVATNDFNQDTSIWALQMIPQDQVPFGSMEVFLFEDNKKTRFLVETDFNVISADPTLERFV